MSIPVVNFQISLVIHFDKILKFGKKSIFEFFLKIINLSKIANIGKKLVELDFESFAKLWNFVRD